MEGGEESAVDCTKSSFFRKHAFCNFRFFRQKKAHGRLCVVLLILEY
jgi:hypothetical protein